MWHFLREAIKDGIVHPWQIRGLPFEWLKYKMGRIDTDLIENAVSFMKGIEKSALERVAQTCFDRRMKNDIYPGAARLIKAIQEKGEKVIFASASFSTVIRPLQHFLGIEDSLACQLEFVDGKTTGRLAGKSLLGINKKEALRHWLSGNGFNAGDTCFYSDSYIDIPALEYCGKAVAVNPDRTLARKAKEKGWEIMLFDMGEKQ